MNEITDEMLDIIEQLKGKEILIYGIHAVNLL